MKNNDSFLSLLNEYGGDTYLIRMERPVFARVAEVRNLPKGVSGTYVEILAENRSVGKTPTKFKERNPFFGEDLFFRLENNEILMTVILWKEKKSGKKNKELGRFTLPFDELGEGDSWYSLDNTRRAGKPPMEIRMSAEYHEITILPTDKYLKLLNMILDKSSEFKVIQLLANSCNKSHEAAELAELIVQIGIVNEIVPEIINCIIVKEIRSADCQETLFRGNSVGSKALDFYMKCVGTRWLNCLRPLIQIIIMSEKVCEVRDSKLKPEDNWIENQKNLLELFSAASAIIFSTVQKCPIPLRKIFRYIREEVRKVFTDPSVEYTAITGFLFLRFFVPAIMTPKLFGLADDYSTGNTERTFTLIATVLQKVANLQLFEPHESHFDSMNEILIAEHERLKKFLDQICTMEDHQQDNDTNILVNEIDQDVILARLCHYISSHQKALEDVIPDKYIVSFLAELGIVFDEMKFLWKNYKNQQKKRRENPAVHLQFSHSAPPTPTISRENKNPRSALKEKNESVKRRHSFSLDRLSLVKSSSKAKIKTDIVINSHNNYLPVVQFEVSADEN